MFRLSAKKLNSLWRVQFCRTVFLILVMAVNFKIGGIEHEKVFYSNGMHACGHRVMSEK